MRKILMSMTAVAILAGAGLATEANARPVRIEGARVQTVYYDGWHRSHHWHYWHHWHHRW
jgi:hypothetical protein